MPQEAAREVRALLDVVSENEATVKKFALGCAEIVKRAMFHLKVLNAEVGDEELIEEVAGALAKLRMWMAGVHPATCACCSSLDAPSELQQGPAGA